MRRRIPVPGAMPYHPSSGGDPGRPTTFVSARSGLDRVSRPHSARAHLRCGVSSGLTLGTGRALQLDRSCGGRPRSPLPFQRVAVTVGITGLPWMWVIAGVSGVVIGVVTTGYTPCALAPSESGPKSTARGRTGRPQPARRGRKQGPRRSVPLLKHSAFAATGGPRSAHH
jgi:hypothetical protein